MLSLNSARNLAIAAVVALSPLQLLAQQNQFSAFQGLQGTLGIQAGSYNFQTFDKGRLQEIVLNQAINLQQQDREYILTTTTALEVMMNALIANVINGTGGIQKMADDSLARATEIDLATLLTAYRVYNTQVTAIENRIVSIMAIPGGMKSIEELSLADSGIVALRTGGQVDLSAVINHYKQQLAQIDATVNSIVYPKVLLANGTPMIQKTLNEILAEAAKTPPYTQAQIQEKIQEETRLRFIGTRERAQLEAIHNVTLKLVMQYVESFGVDQRYRLNTTPEERTAILNDLQEVFWARSLLRGLYGVGLGAIGIQFNTRSFNAEYVFAKNQLQFLNRVTAIEQINAQRRTLLIALGVMDSRNDEILAAEIPFMNRVFSGLTFISGNAQLADVNTEILKLLYADMVEEAVIANDGFYGMRNHYQTRWYTGQSESDVAAIRARARDWREQLVTSDVATPRGAFFVAQQALESFRVNLDLAEKIRTEIEMFQAGSELFSRFKELDDTL